jgi:hypothetical protein
MASVWDKPEAMDFADVAGRLPKVIVIMQAIGLLLWVIVPFPNCPDALFPHVHNVPSPFRATVWEPADIDVTPVRALTCTGLFCWVVDPSPS